MSIYLSIYLFGWIPAYLFLRIFLFKMVADDWIEVAYRFGATTFWPFFVILTVFDMISKGLKKTKPPRWL